MVATDNNMNMKSKMDSSMSRLSMLHSHVKDRSQEEIVPTFPQLPRQERELLLKSSFQSLLKNLSLPSQARVVPYDGVNNAKVTLEGVDRRGIDFHISGIPLHTSNGLLSQDVGQLLGVNHNSSMVVVKTGSEIAMVDILTGKSNKLAYFAIDILPEQSMIEEDVKSGTSELQNHGSLAMFSGLDIETVQNTMKEAHYDAVVLEYGNVSNYQELIQSIHEFGDDVTVILHIPSAVETVTISDIDVDLVLLSTNIDGTLLIDLNNSNNLLQKELKNAQLETKIESGVIQVLSEPFEIDRKKIYKIYDHVRGRIRTEESERMTTGENDV